MSHAPLKPTFLDRALLKLSPQRGLQRMLAKERVREFGYDAAHPGTARGQSGGHAKNAASESWRATRDAVNLMWDARDCVRNIGILRGLVKKLSMYVTGRLSYKANTGDEGADKLLTDWFHEQCKPENIDITGRHRFRKMVDLGFCGALVDGRFGYAPVRETPQSPLKFQMIEGDRIGNPLEAMQDERYIRGIHIGDAGQVLGYRVFDRKRTGMYENPRDLSAENFIYLWDPERADEYGGVSWLQCALPKARDYYEWFAIEMAAAKHNSTYAAFLRSKSGFNQGAVAWDGKTAVGTPTQDAQFGKIVQLGEGEEIQFANMPARPSGSFLQGLEALAREVALALNLPFGFVYNMALLGGVTARIEIMQAVRVIQYWQHDVLGPRLDQMKNMKLADGIARGEIPATFKDRGDGLLVPSWMCGHWEFGPWLTGDVGNQTNADILLMQHGIKTEDDLSAEYMGRPAVESAEKIVANIQMHQRLGEQGVPLELQAPARFPNATALLAASNTPPPPPPAPGSQEAVGDHGAKQIIEMLTSVTEGRLDRDACIQSLITVYGLDDEAAEELTPHPRKQPSEKKKKPRD